MELGDRRVHRVEVGGALIGDMAGKLRFPDDPAVDQVHDEEGRADDRFVLAQAMDARHRKSSRAERAHHPCFALDRMGAGQQLAGRLAAQDEGRPDGVSSR